MNAKTIAKNKVKILPQLNRATETYYPSEELRRKGKTDFERIQIYNLEQPLRIFLKNNNDAYLASNLFFYYKEGNPNRRFASDIMICFGVENKMRRTYKLWEEKIVPQIIIEVVSKETWQNDVTTKRRLFERLGVEEYYVIDPEYKYLPAPLFAYRLEFGELVRQSIDDKRIFSPVLNLELVDTEKEFRFFNPETREFLPTNLELSQINENILSENEKLKAEIARLKGKK